MRITNNMLINNMLGSLSTNLGRTSKYQDQLATGKKISKPSDDPIVASKSLKLRTDVAEIAQYKRNTEDATSWMDSTESTIGQLGDVMTRLRELTVQAANGTNTTSDLQKIETEVDQLKKQATHLANASYAGRYIFSGYKTDKPFMDEKGNFLQSVNKSENILFEIGIGDNLGINVTGGDLFNGGANAVGDTAGTSMGTSTISFPLTINAANNGMNLTVDGEAVAVTIPSATYTDPFTLLTSVQTAINNATTTAGDVTASFSSGRLMLTSSTTGAASAINVTGGSALGSLGMGTLTQVPGTVGSKGTLMQLFDNILVGLNSGDTKAVGSLLSSVDQEIDNILRARSGVGARMNRLEMTTNRLTDDNIGFTKLMSQNEDVDMAEAIMNLSNEESVYKASLSTGARVIQPSLVDYIR